jgi:hypothetical protein
MHSLQTTFRLCKGVLWPALEFLESQYLLLPFMFILNLNHVSSDKYRSYISRNFPATNSWNDHQYPASSHSVQKSLIWLQHGTVVMLKVCFIWSGPLTSHCEESAWTKVCVCGVLLISSISFTLKYDLLILSFYSALCQSIRNFRLFAFFFMALLIWKFFAKCSTPLLLCILDKSTAKKQLSFSWVYFKSALIQCVLWN